TNFVWDGGFGINAGRWVTGGYSPFVNSTTTLFSNGTLGSFNAANPLMAGVASLNAFYRMVAIPAPGAVVVASWNDGPPLIAYQAAGVPVPNAGKRAVGINAYLGENPGGATFSGDFARVIMNAAHWLSPLVDTVAPGTFIPPFPGGVPSFLKDKNIIVTWQ